MMAAAILFLYALGVTLGVVGLLMKIDRALSQNLSQNNIFETADTLLR